MAEQLITSPTTENTSLTQKKTRNLEFEGILGKSKYNTVVGDVKILLENNIELLLSKSCLLKQGFDVNKKLGKLTIEKEGGTIAKLYEQN
eukprot:snap_masked-scaffold_2-processed-gene-26.13-mRNA-1 protein AED:1.00 eAED:1.00 QI:0/0/0/0/1/1/2/0/89